jgi:hypothetical protein
MMGPYYAEAQKFGDSTWYAGWRHASDELESSDIRQRFEDRDAAIQWLVAELTWIAIDDPDILEPDKDVALGIAAKVHQENRFPGRAITIDINDITYYVER